MFKIKDSYKLELQAPGTIINEQKKQQQKTKKNGAKTPRTWSSRNGFIQCNLVDNW